MTGDGLEHPALVYGSVAEFLSVMVPFVAAGLDRLEPVFAAVGAEEVAALRDRFGSDSPGMVLADTLRWHPHTGNRLRAFHEFTRARMADGARRVRLVGEPAWPAGPPELVTEWQRYESILNEMLRPLPVTLVCTYPASRLDPSIAASAPRTHPVLWNGSAEASPGYEDPARFVRRSNPKLTPEPPSATVMPGPADPGTARRFLETMALRSGLPPKRARDLVVAANEIVTNALIHGSGSVTVSAWTDDDRFVAQVEDQGPGIADPFAGYRPPAAGAPAGRGLWIARQLVDFLQIGPVDAGTTIRLHVFRGPARG